MDEPRRDDPARRYDDTEHPNNPPNSVLSKQSRRATVWSYFVPIIVLFVVVGVALLYWANRPAHSVTSSDEGQEVGTIGSTEGGFDPQLSHRPGTTQQEIEQRGSDLEPVTSLDELRDVNPGTAAGRRVMLSDVEIETAAGNRLWVRDDDRRFPVVAPEGTPALSNGATADVSGHVEPDGNGGIQIRADRIAKK